MGTMVMRTRHIITSYIAYFVLYFILSCLLFYVLLSLILTSFMSSVILISFILPVCPVQIQINHRRPDNVD